MISRARLSGRSTRLGVWALGVLACIEFAFTLSATPALATCPNEQLRSESNINPTTGQAYSLGLPDCRAYEMVSPLYKQGHGALPSPLAGIAVAPGGETAGWESEGDFAEPENYTIHGHPNNPYLSQRRASGWSTSSAFAPYPFVENLIPRGLEGDASPDLRSARVSCGTTASIKGQNAGDHLVCARRQDGTWDSTPLYTGVADQSTGQGVSEQLYIGGSLDLSRLFLIAVEPLVPSDNELKSGGIYEIARCCSPSSTLRLVNVDNGGHELVFRENGNKYGPLIGQHTESIPGTEYHAVSTSGTTVFFTATPFSAKPPFSEIETVYARTPCVLTVLNKETCQEEHEGTSGEFFETVPVSNPTKLECNECLNGEAKSAAFEGASADGSKVFFTTKQKLLPNSDETRNLYEYDFKRPEGERLVLLSPAPAGKHAQVMGIVRSSPDGSHVYFVANGVLTGEEKNKYGEKAEEEGHSNLYGYDTVTGEKKFVATAAPKSGTIVPHLAGEVEDLEGRVRWLSSDEQRPAQTTPDGRYLVFSGQLSTAGDTNTVGCNTGSCPLAVYRYDFQTGALEWVSRPAPGFSAPNEGKSALIPPLPGGDDGAEAHIDGWNRAISGCPPKGLRSEAEEAEFSCPEGQYDGEYIIFVTKEQLQENGVSNAPTLYEWHNGEVHRISDGRAPDGVEAVEATTAHQPVAMSASGSDIFFITATTLVGQDTDTLHDLYDARIGGGFPAPPAPACSGEGCQPPPPAHEPFPLAASSLFTGGQNVPPGTVSVVPSVKPKPARLTRAQLLAKALKACKKKPRKKRKACERQARKKYGAKAKPKKGKSKKGRAKK
jgi:hypothetical protein